MLAIDIEGSVQLEMIPAVRLFPYTGLYSPKFKGPSSNNNDFLLSWCVWIQKEKQSAIFSATARPMTFYSTIRILIHNYNFIQSHNCAGRFASIGSSILSYGCCCGRTPNAVAIASQVLMNSWTVLNNRRHHSSHDTVDCTFADVLCGQAGGG